MSKGELAGKTTDLSGQGAFEETKEKKEGISSLERWAGILGKV